MSVTVRQLAEWVNGIVVGDETVPIRAARPLTEAGPGDVTFVEGDRNFATWHASQASAAFVTKSVTLNGRPLIQVADPLLAFATVVMQLKGHREPSANKRIHPTASIHPTATIGPDATIGPFVVVGEGTVIGARVHLHAGVSVGRFCQLADDVTLYPHVVLYDDCVLGNRVMIHANSVIGADGFGYRTHNGAHVKVPQLGSVEISDDVEIGASTTIDRGTFGPTRIGTGTKIDNLVQIGHNCQIGRHNLLVSQVGIAGSCTTGDYVVMAGQVGIGDHVNIGDRATLGAKAGVAQDVPPKARLLGAPAIPDREQMKIWFCLAKLPELRKDFLKMKRQLGMEEPAE